MKRDDLTLEMYIKYLLSESEGVLKLYDYIAKNPGKYSGEIAEEVYGTKNIQSLQGICAKRLIKINELENIIQKPKYNEVLSNVLFNFEKDKETKRWKFYLKPKLLEALDFIKQNEDMLYKSECKDKENIEKVDRNSSLYKRSSKIKVKKLEEVNYACELDRNHMTFEKENGNPYIEIHHLIPLHIQYQYSQNLDIVENLIALCPNCHRQIHYGKGKRIIIEKILNERKQKLKKRNIEVTLEKLLEYYSLGKYLK